MWNQSPDIARVEARFDGHARDRRKSNPAARRGCFKTRD
jgi:hypothetical protein